MTNQPSRAALSSTLSREHSANPVGRVTPCAPQAPGAHGVTRPTIPGAGLPNTYLCLPLCPSLKSFRLRDKVRDKVEDKVRDELCAPPVC